MLTSFSGFLGGSWWGDEKPLAGFFASVLVFQGRAATGEIPAAAALPSELPYEAISIMRFFFTTFSTSAATTLYSGHIVSPSQPGPVTLFTMASGKWKVV